MASNINISNMEKHFFLDFNNNNTKIISIFSQHGNVLYLKKSDNKSEELKLDFLASGVYLLTIQEEGITYSQKIVKF